MRSVFRYEALALVRDRALLGWTLAFSLVMSLIFMAMFSNLDESYAPEPIAFGIVKDEAYDAAPGLAPLIDAASTTGGEDAASRGDEQERDVPEVIIPVDYPTSAAARADSDSGRIAGYIAVIDREPHVFVTVAGNRANSVWVLRAILDSYVQRIGELESLAASGAPGELIEELASSQSDFTFEFHPTANPPDSSAGYYMSLLGFSCGMGIMVSMTSARRLFATTSPLGARRSLAGLPRWRILGAVIAAAWACIFASMLIVYHFIRWVVGVDLGAHLLLAHLAIGASTLMACSLGALFGSFPKLQLGMVSGIVSLLSLFTGLYGPFSGALEAKLRHDAPVAAALNPLWQIVQSFHSLLYYDSLGPFLVSVGSLLTMSTVFFTLALLRLRRMSHAHL